MAQRRRINKVKNIRLLDCTLRDGGRIINCAFSNDEIMGLSYGLSTTGIDIVEVGFLRDGRNVVYNGNSTFFTEVNQITPYLNKSSDVMYVAFVDYGLYDFESLELNDGKSIDGIRFGFTKADYTLSKADIKKCILEIKKKGYKVFVQGVNTLNYTDKELLDVIEMINELHPYSFGIVDTYGAMYLDDVNRVYSLIDHNMDYDICIDFHSHNNYQLSFALAQEVIRLSEESGRSLIVDGTLGGMGKVAGNLNIELIADFLVRKKHCLYEIDNIFDLLDEYIYKYKAKYSWGYSTQSLMSGILKSHPNNVLYLTEKYSLQSKDIGKILSMIAPDKRQRYDYDEIERLYIEYTSTKIDDRNALNQIKGMIKDREVLIMVPGNTLNTHRREIDKYIDEHELFVISVNFVADYSEAVAFFGNEKRYCYKKEKHNGRTLIVTSNIKGSTEEIVVNYASLINRGYRYFENSTMMLLNLLRRVGVKAITFAGFDGFAVDKETNYSDDSFQNDRYIDKFGELNYEIHNMLSDYHKSVSGICRISFLTPSIFEEEII